MSTNQTDQSQYLSDEPTDPDEQIDDTDLPDNVTVGGGSEEQQQATLAQQANISEELQEIQSQEASGAYNIEVQKSYSVDGETYQKVNYKGIDATGYRTASGNKISEREFFENAPSETRNKKKGEQITQYQFNEGNDYYRTAESGGTPTRENVNSVEWANASKYEIEGYQGPGNGNATIMTPDGLQRTTRQEVRIAMRAVNAYNHNDVNQTVEINGNTYTAAEMAEAVGRTPLPNAQIFIYDGD